MLLGYKTPELEVELPHLGAHMSTAGGVETAIDRAKKLDLESLQIFTKNNNQWKGKPLSEESIKKFKDGVKEAGIKVTNAHDSYLINLCSPKEDVSKKSFDAFIDEMERAEQLELDYLVMHPGSHLKEGEEIGLKKISKAFNSILKETKGYKTIILLETTAGQGTNLGYKFEHLKTIIDNISEPERMGVCLDTCHVFAAGYKITTKSGYEETMYQFDKLVGIDKLRMFHMNDSKTPFGSRVDRHEHIGVGNIGKNAFKFILNDPRFADRAMVLETPKGDDFVKNDLRNLNLLRSMIN